MFLVFGAIAMDVLMVLPHLPQPYHSPITDTYHLRPGGKAANQAVAAARAGASVKLFGRIGQDEFGKKLLENLRHNQVDVAGVDMGAQPTAMIHIAVAPGGVYQRAIAGGAFLGSRSLAVPDQLISPTTICLAQTEVPLEETGQLFQRIRAKSGYTILSADPQPKGINRGLLQHVSLLIVNQTTGKFIAHQLGLGADMPPEDLVFELANAFHGECLLTLGDQGAVAATFGGVYQFGTLQVQVVDSYGASDAMAGALAAALYQSMPLTDAINRGLLAGSLSCLALGAQDGMPLKSTIDEWIGDMPKPVRL